MGTAVKIEVANQKFIALASSSAAWTLKSGSSPVIHTFDMIPKHLEALLKLSHGKPVTITFSSSNKDTIEVKNAYVLYPVPADNKYLARVAIADRRWFWQLGYIVKKYNIRRNIGYRRANTPTDSTLNDQQNLVLPVFWYSQWSLNPATKDKWLAKEIVDDVIKEAIKKETEYSGLTATIKYEDTISADIPIEDLLIDDKGNNAVSVAMGYLPQTNLYVDYDGTIVIYNKTSGKEAKLISDLKFELDGMGHIAKVDFSNIRPSAINVYFTREVETRFDFTEPLNKGSTTPPIDDDTRDLDNVLPLPDFSLRYSSDPVNVTRCQGTFVEFQETISAWFAQGSFPENIVLDYNILRKAMIPFIDMASAMLLNGSINPDVDWTARMQALLGNFRTTFRIKRKWMDRIQAIKNYRVATIDQASGQRAPAVVYSATSFTNSQRAFLTANSDKDAAWISVGTSYPAGGVVDGNTLPAPAKINVISSDMGIINIEYFIDKVKLHESILPGHIIQEGENVAYDAHPIIGGPRGNIAQQVVPCAMNGVGATLTNGDPTDYSVLHTQPMLNPNYRCSVILTAIPAGNNANYLAQFHKITVKPSDIKDMISPALGLENCCAPPMDIHIGSSIEVARIRWLDSKATEIEKIFKPELGTPDLSGLVMNETVAGDTAPHGASLNEIAKAFATRAYATLIDRFQGSAAGNFNSKLKPSGWSDEVQSEIDPQGVATTRINLPAHIPPLDFFSYLSGSTRATILKLAPQGGVSKI